MGRLHKFLGRKTNPNVGRVVLNREGPGGNDIQRGSCTKRRGSYMTTSNLQSRTAERRIEGTRREKHSLRREVSGPTLSSHTN